MPVLNLVARTVRQWANRMAPVTVQVQLEGTRDADTREWVPGTSETHTIRAIVLPTLTVMTSMGLQFGPEAPYTADDQDIFIPVKEDGAVLDEYGEAIAFQVQGEGRDGTKILPTGSEGPSYEVIQEVGDFSSLGGYRWFRSRRSAVK